MCVGYVTYFCLIGEVGKEGGEGGGGGGGWVVCLLYRFYLLVPKRLTT